EYLKEHAPMTAQPPAAWPVDLLLWFHYPSTPFAEAFRHLRTNIYYSDESHGPQVLLFTSPCPGDGKTLCTLQLASALAADGKRVLVIEADLRRPSLHLFLGEQSEPGLGDLPARDDITRPIEGWFGSFDCVMAGAPTESPAELLSGARFGELVRQARNAYDFVLIDSPPFPLVSDALIVAMHADRVFSVVRPHNTRRVAAREHLQRLSAASRRHAVVINDTSAGDAYDNYGTVRSAGRRRLRKGLLAVRTGAAGN
ncbi:MAG TPA: CpsD/CapB family tyrosine-protein kinase, partial [Polyangia bacterium]|nr:CpsD/CapB family tyrosine-protein kinase [Polyangia bacterium]